MKLIHVIIAWIRKFFTSNSTSTEVVQPPVKTQHSNQKSLVNTLPATTKINLGKKGFRHPKKVWTPKLGHRLQNEHFGTFSPVKPLAKWHPNTKPMDRRSFWSRWRMFDSWGTKEKTS